MDKVDNIILVMSGKGGVGKSTLSVKLAQGLLRAGHRVGLLDVDLCGPSIPAMLGVENEEIYESEEEKGWWRPVLTPGKEGQQLAVMSIAFLAKSKTQPVIWKGPKKTSFIKDYFINKVNWGELDYLVVDTPPGTSDEHLSLIETFDMNITKALIVSTPQLVAIGDVRREIKFCRKVGLQMAGIVENMSGYVCPHCSTCTNIFSSLGGEKLAEKEKLAFLGRIPIDPKIAEMLDNGTSDADSSSSSNESTWKAIDQVVSQLQQVISG